MLSDLLFLERRYGAISMALNHVSSVTEQEPFGGKCFWSHFRLSSALNVNEEIYCKAVLSTVKLNHIWPSGFFFLFYIG